MNLLVVGVSYRTATVAVLERLAASPQEAPHLLTDLLARPYVAEAMVLSTCNRVEVYAAVTAFHGGLADIADVLAARAGCTATDLAGHMYVQFEADAARHAFRVATGLDSMVVGEAQILGQLREAYLLATERDTAGRMLHELMQQALRVGKRAHTETGIDRSGQNVVTAALTVAGRHLAGPGSDPDPGTGIEGVAGHDALVVGAGAMGSLALATLRRHGAGALYVANRDPQRARRLAEAYGAAPVSFDTLADTIARVDLVVCATAASGHVITPHQVRRPVVLLDLAIPRDVDPTVATMPGVTLIDMQGLASEVHPATGIDADSVAVEAIVASEVDAYRLTRRGADAAPTVAALRSRADEVVAAELSRLRQRTPGFSDAERAEVAQTVHRVVQRLLHQPTVRVRELAAGPGGDHYAEVLRDLFALDVTPTAENAAQVPPGACETDAGGAV